MKKAFYVTCFAVLGLLIATLVHAGVEMLLLSAIFGNPEQFAASFWWQEWAMIHRVGGGLLWLAGLAGGAWLGFTYWRIIYVEKRRTS